MNDLTCPVCGRSRMSHLTAHLSKAHGISKSEALSQFPGIQLISSDLLEAKKAKLDEQRALNWQSEDYKNKMAKAAKQNMQKLNSDPAIRELAQSKSYESRMEHAKADPEWWSAVRSDAAIKCWQNESRHEAHSKMLADQWKDPEYRTKHTERFSRQLKELWSDSDKVKSTRMGYFTHRIIPYETWLGDKVHLRSSYEYILATILDKYKICYKYEGTSIRYSYQGEFHSYIPDFILYEYDILIEVKPTRMVNDLVIAKLNQCEYIGYTPILITEEDLFLEPEQIINRIEVKSSTTIERVSAS